ncbi:MAG: tryptophan 7-halogenase [Gammaproteobacteria bacterium]|nr:tryptophan 7-halogenase [Gammaproteobacteria bacterium]
MTEPVKRLIVVGGGSAGWLTAGTLAAEHQAHLPTGVEVILVESPDVKIIGVGEGTWPTMRNTLKKLGIAETDFVRDCDASFKQGSKFCGWVNGQQDDVYYHPFTLPEGYNRLNLAPAWQQQRQHIKFADAVCFQPALCERGLAPKQITTPEYASVANYGYHLDAGKFARLLQKHCTEKLGVKHILDHVTGINSHPDGDIASLATRQHGNIEADLFIDCSGFKSLLLGEHFGIPFVSKKDTLFIDSALAVQVPYPEPDSPIASHTISTAQSAGWIWDIGLPSRRGVGHVFSSAHISPQQAEAQLRAYIRPSLGPQADDLPLRQIAINPGHRQKFWHRNCVAVGMAAGFLEPLEASALVLVELSAAMISEQLPATRGVMDIVARRFNDTFSYRWDRVIDFLKLHYVLSLREDSDFWADNRSDSSIPDSLQELLQLWQYHYPWHSDFSRADEIFSSASYQYVLYGMGFATRPRATAEAENYNQQASQYFQENARRLDKLLTALPNNRQLLNKIKHFGLQKI